MKLGYCPPPTNRPLMACGHSANSTRDGQPACVICCPNADAYKVAEVQPDLTGRLAKCWACQREVPSRLELPFFEWLDGDAVDRWYCGCRGM
jgi:hypothetical protein